MVPDGQKVRTDGMDGRMGWTDDAENISLLLRRWIINRRNPTAILIKTKQKTLVQQFINIRTIE